MTGQDTPATGAPEPDAFGHVTTWIFDLDNTLYPARSNLFAQIDQRMEGYIASLLGLEAAAARRLQKEYYHRYGTTLKGLMVEHQVAPEHFLAHVHDIDVSGLQPDEALTDGLTALPGRRLVFTNGSVAHAENILARLKIDHLFEGIFDITAAGYDPKPLPRTYDLMVAATGTNPAKAAMFEDLPANLVPAHALGMRTVLIAHDNEAAHGPKAAPATDAASLDHIHHVTDDLAAFLSDLNGVLSPGD
ncbi:MAG: pyrimidine 5'-nucleotidase [Pseudomonadota bacterium]